MRLINSRFHFIGVGGVGMSGLAELLYNMGAKVSGSDLVLNPLTERLQILGVRIFIGHMAQNVGDVDVVVYSSAIKRDNPELLEARRRHIPTIPRAEVLAEIMRLKRGIAVGGTHGKTTTTSMLASIFIRAGLDPTIVVGGRLDLIKSTALLGQGEWLIGEADESDGSFLKLSPELAVITNIDDDHIDHYKSIENLEQAFVEFALRVPFYGTAVVCGDSARVRKLFEGFNKRVLFYGFDPANHFQIKIADFRESFTAFSYQVLSQDKSGSKTWGSFQLQVPGKHNALNALAGIIIALEAGLTFEVARAGVEAFGGVDRRLQKRGEVGGITVIDDYGHHPTEIKAVIQALKEKYPSQRLILVFQPHRYSRTKLCWENFKTCFAGADQVYWLDICSAGEPELEGITSQKLSAELTALSSSYVGSRTEAIKILTGTLKNGDIVVTLGAGDISKLGPELLSGLAKTTMTTTKS